MFTLVNTRDKQEGGLHRWITTCPNLFRLARMIMKYEFGYGGKIIVIDTGAKLYGSQPSWFVIRTSLMLTTCTDITEVFGPAPEITKLLAFLQSRYPNRVPNFDRNYRDAEDTRFQMSRDWKRANPNCSTQEYIQMSRVFRSALDVMSIC